MCLEADQTWIRTIRTVAATASRTETLANSLYLLLTVNLNIVRIYFALASVDFSQMNKKIDRIHFLQLI